MPSQVDGSRDVWEHILCRLYPVFPKPRIDVEAAAAVLPVAAKYNLLPVVAELNAQLLRVFPASLSADPRSPCYVIRCEERGVACRGRREGREGDDVVVSRVG